MTEQNRRVATLLPLEIGGARQPAGFVMSLPPRHAQAMIDEGRAKDAPADAPAAAPASQPIAVNPQPAAPATRDSK